VDPSGGLGAVPLKEIFLGKILVKYCNFVVNLYYSLCHGSNNRSYINLGFFAPGKKPSFIYERIVL
jgi:hypothetical protein